MFIYFYKEFRKLCKINLILLLNSIADILDIRQISIGKYNIEPVRFDFNKFMKSFYKIV